MDRGHQLTEQVINKIEGRLVAEYTQAAKEVAETLNDYMARFKLKDKKWQEWVKDGTHTADEYAAWRRQQIMAGDRWKKLKEQLASDMVDANVTARNIAETYMPEVWQINANYALYDVEVGSGVDTSLTLYNREAIAMIMKDDPDLMPMGKQVLGELARGKAERWERQRIQSLMIQGILQGKSNVRIAEDIAKNLANGDFKASMRYARTMSTNAQNGGRYGAYRRLERNGVPLTLEWAATLDNRTRHEHRLMHGQRRNVNEPFEVDGVEILYPAWLGTTSYKVPPDMIWNCRCTILAFVKGFEHDTIRKSEKMGEMSFDEWLNAKEQTDPITKQRDIGRKMRAINAAKYGGKGGGKVKEEPERIKKPVNVDDPKALKEAYIHINPNYNPKSEKTYDEFLWNCNKCVVAFEANMRGDDVEALPYKFGFDADFSNNPEKAFGMKRSDGWIMGVGGMKAKIALKRTVENIELEMEDYGVGARGIITYRNSDGKAGHTFNVVQTSDGTKYIDAQAGKEMKPSEAFKNASIKSITLYRTDNTEIDEEIAKRAYRKREK